MDTQKTNITKLTEKYIQEHPSIMDNLKKGLINYSALARKIGKELNINKFDAILIASRRYASKLKTQKTREKEIIEILKKSKFEVKNKIIAVILDPNIYFDNLIELHKIIKKKDGVLHFIQGSSSITLITSLEFLPEIKDYFKNKIEKINLNLIEITLISPEKLEDTPGVMSYLYSLFAENDINIVETMSCYTDTLFLIEESNIQKALKILNI